MSLKLRWLIVGLLSLTILISGIIIDSRYFSSYRLTVNYQTISSTKLPSSHNGMSIACFGDLEFGTFMDFDRLENLVEKINRLSPDAVFFLGDLYDRNYSPDQETKLKVIELLSNIKAPEGKFAVLGDFDQDQADVVQSDLLSASFEVLNNQVLQLHHGTNDYIYLIGLNNDVINNGSISDVYSYVEDGVFSICISHNPDIVTSLPINSTNVLIASNAHGSQKNWPFNQEKTNNYEPGKHIYDSTTIYASKGVGTTKEDIRLFSDPEIYFFKLSH